MSEPAYKIDNTIIEVLSRYPQIRMAILFGSSANAKDTMESDLDLAVLTNEPLGSDTSIQIIGALASRFGRPVDLIDLRTAGEPLFGDLLKGRRILGDDTTYANLISRHLFHAAAFLPYRNRILAERRARWIAS